MAENEKNIENAPEVEPFQDFLNDVDVETLKRYKRLIDKAIPGREVKEAAEEFEKLSEQDKLLVSIERATKEGNLIESVKLQDEFYSKYGRGS